MPNYEDLASQGVYIDASTGIKVFAGQRAETFYIDLGAVFDTANLRRKPLPLLTASRGRRRYQGSVWRQSFQRHQRQHHRHRSAD